MKIYEKQESENSKHSTNDLSNNVTPNVHHLMTHSFPSSVLCSTRQQPDAAYGTDKLNQCIKLFFYGSSTTTATVDGASFFRPTNTHPQNSSFAPHGTQILQHQRHALPTGSTRTRKAPPSRRFDAIKISKDVVVSSLSTHVQNLQLHFS